MCCMADTVSIHLSGLMKNSFLWIYPTLFFISYFSEIMEMVKACPTVLDSIYLMCVTSLFAYWKTRELYMYTVHIYMAGVFSFALFVFSMNSCQVVSWLQGESIVMEHCVVALEHQREQQNDITLFFIKSQYFIAFLFWVLNIFSSVHTKGMCSYFGYDDPGHALFGYINLLNKHVCIFHLKTVAFQKSLH